MALINQAIKGNYVIKRPLDNGEYGKVFNLKDLNDTNQGVQYVIKL